MVRRRGRGAADVVLGLAQQHLRLRLRLDAESSSSATRRRDGVSDGLAITALDVGRQCEAVGPLVVRRRARDPIGPRRRLVEVAGDEEQFAEPQSRGVDEASRTSSTAPVNSSVSRSTNGSPRQRGHARSRLAIVARRSPRRSASSAAATSSRNCQRSTSTWGGWARATRPRCRFAGPATRAVSRGPVRARHAVATTSPARCARRRTGSRSGHISSPIRSRRNGPASTSSSSSVRTRLRRSSERGFLDGVLARPRPSSGPSTEIRTGGCARRATSPSSSAAPRHRHGRRHVPRHAPAPCATPPAPARPVLRPG